MYIQCTCMLNTDGLKRMHNKLTIQIPRVRVAQLKNDVVFDEDKHNVLQETVNSMFYEKYVNLCFKPSVFSMHVHCIYTYITNSYLAILISILYYFGFCNFCHKSVADESFINETRVHRSKLFAWNLINLLFISPFF
jgi:hypothetical protein